MVCFAAKMTSKSNVSDSYGVTVESMRELRKRDRPDPSLISSIVSTFADIDYRSSRDRRALIGVNSKNRLKTTLIYSTGQHILHVDTANSVVITDHHNPPLWVTVFVEHSPPGIVSAFDSAVDKRTKTKTEKGNARRTGIHAKDTLVTQNRVRNSLCLSFDRIHFDFLSQSMLSICVDAFIIILFLSDCTSPAVVVDVVDSININIIAASLVLPSVCCLSMFRNATAPCRCAFVQLCVVRACVHVFLLHFLAFACRLSSFPLFISLRTGLLFVDIENCKIERTKILINEINKRTDTHTYIMHSKNTTRLQLQTCATWKFDNNDNDSMHVTRRNAINYQFRFECSEWNG